MLTHMPQWNSDTVRDEGTKVLAVTAVTAILFWFIHETGYSLHPISPLMVGFAIGRAVRASWFELLLYAILTSFVLLFVGDHYAIKEQDIALYMLALFILCASYKGTERDRKELARLRSQNSSLRTALDDMYAQYNADKES